jgi:hypothetical protein
MKNIKGVKMKNKKIVNMKNKTIVNKINNNNYYYNQQMKRYSKNNLKVRIILIKTKEKKINI